MDTIATFLTFETLVSVVECAERTGMQLFSAWDNKSTQGASSDSSLKSAKCVRETPMVAPRIEALPTVYVLSGLVTTTLTTPSRTDTRYVGFL